MSSFSCMTPQNIVGSPYMENQMWMLILKCSCLAFTGPISGPKEAEFVLKRTNGVHGFYGASSMERLPVEEAITVTVQQYKSIALKWKTWFLVFKYTLLCYLFVYFIFKDFTTVPEPFFLYQYHTSFFLKLCDFLPSIFHLCVIRNVFSLVCFWKWLLFIIRWTLLMLLENNYSTLGWWSKHLKSKLVILPHLFNVTRITSFSWDWTCQVLFDTMIC